MMLKKTIIRFTKKKLYNNNNNGDGGGNDGGYYETFIYPRTLYKAAPINCAFSSFFVICLE